VEGCGLGNNGVVVTLKDKTGIPRRIPLFDCVQYLATWKNDYPFKPEGDAVVFVTEQHHPLRYEGIRRQLKTIAKRAGITRPFKSHDIRHSRVTHMSQEGYSDAAMKQQHWGHQRTDMLKTYAHITYRDLEREVMEHHGIQPREPCDTTLLAARQCILCGTYNAPTRNYCTTCGHPLNREEGHPHEEPSKGCESNKNPTGACAPTTWWISAPLGNYDGMSGVQVVAVENTGNGR